MPEQVLWTIDDVAVYCQVRPSVVRYWLQTTDLPFVKIGRQVRFDQEDVRDWIENLKVRGTETMELLKRL